MGAKLLSKNTFVSLIIISVILRVVLAFYYPISSDACWHANVVRFIGNELRIPFEENLGRDVFWSPFLFHITASLFYLAAGLISVAFAVFSIKLVPVIFSIGVILLTFLIAKEVLSENHAYMATLFVAFIPHLISLSATVYLETALTFFVLLTVYLSMKGKPYLAAISLGASAFTKYSGFAIVPFFVYALWKGSKKDFFKKLVISFLIILMVSSPVLIRNSVHLKNPFWPFFKGIFGGIEKDSDIKSINPSEKNLLQIPEAFSVIYLSFFGVPNGRFSNLHYLQLPYLNAFVLIWFFATFIFIFPLVLGAANLKVLKGNLARVLFWVVPFLMLPFIYLVDTGIVNDIGRYAVPAYPALAMIFSIGLMSKQMSKFAKKYFVLFTLLIFAFSAQEAIKTAVAHNAWKSYDGDYRAISQLVPESSKFYANGQCPAFYTNHLVWQMPDKGFKPEKGGYIFINQEHKTDYMKVSEESLLVIETNKKIFENNSTGSRLYAVE